jgi:hypothetical protein
VHHRIGRMRAFGASLALASLTLTAAGPALAANAGPLGHFKHIVVI